MARLPAKFILQNVACVLRGVRRDPHVYGVRVATARPPVRVEPGQMKNVSKAPAVRLSSSVTAKKRDLVVGFLQREELHLLRVVFSPERAIFEGVVVTRVLKPGHYLGLVLRPRSLLQPTQQLHLLRQAQSPGTLLRQHLFQARRERRVDPVYQILIGGG